MVSEHISIHRQGLTSTLPLLPLLGSLSTTYFSIAIFFRMIFFRATYISARSSSARDPATSSPCIRPASTFSGIKRARSSHLACVGHLLLRSSLRARPGDLLTSRASCYELSSRTACLSVPGRPSALCSGSFTMAAASSQSGATSSSVPSGESGALKPESSPAPGIFDFTVADFLDKPLSHKVTHPLPPVPESMRPNGLNFLK